MGKRALITGIGGQDGAYLAELLLKKGYTVYGAHRRSASRHLWRLEELGIDDEIRLVPFELLEYSNIWRTLETVEPDEVYNLAAQSFVGVSFEQPLYTADVDGLGPLRLLEAIRVVKPDARFYQASTSEMFGEVLETPQRETTPFNPRSPYAFAKTMAHFATANYAAAYGIHASSGILFNHESPLRGREFVTRKITLGLARIKMGQQDVLELGNLDAKRDWGFAGDYVEGMWRMLQQPEGDTYVLATGESHSVRDFVDAAAEHLGFRLEWQGSGVTEHAIDATRGQTIVRVNPEFFRPAEVDALVGNASKAAVQLGWSPRISFQTLVSDMVQADITRLQQRSSSVADAPA